MTLVTEAIINLIMPKCPSAAAWVGPLSAAMTRFDIDDGRRTAAFLAQVAEESGELTRLVESLNYSAKRLIEVWPRRFPTLKKAVDYANAPQKLANYVYASRLGNGDEASGDGWKYRGRGLIQTTGRANYRSAGTSLGLPLETQPELLEQPDAAALSAAWFWKTHGLNELADAGGLGDEEDFETISIRINGGLQGIEARKAYWRSAQAALSVS
jgi:putative chitinase